MQRNLDHLLHRMHPDDEIGLFLDTQRDGSVQRLATSGTAEREDVEEGGEDGTPPPTTTLRGSMWLPNGLALDGDERYLVVGEAHANRVVRIALDGGDADRVLLPNLPGFAEQITRWDRCASLPVYLFLVVYVSLRVDAPMMRNARSNGAATGTRRASSGWHCRRRASCASRPLPHTPH